MNLERIRKSLKLTQAQAAAAVGVHPNTWAKWERGEQRITTSHMILIEALPRLVEKSRVSS